MAGIIKQFGKLSLRSHANINKLSVLKFLQSRQSSFYSSPLTTNIETPKVDYEVSTNPEEWQAVESILPPLTVPAPQPKSSYASGWKPQSADALKQPYFVRRTKNHMIPVYMHTSYRGSRRLTFIRKIQGDIWQLDKDIKEFLQKDSDKPIRSQVNEFVGYICIHGDHVNAVKFWLTEHKF